VIDTFVAQSGTPILFMSTAFKVRPACAVDLAFVIEPDGGQFHAYCPQLKGLHIDGADEQEAFDRAIHAAEIYLLSLSRHGETVATDVRVEVPEGAILRTVTLEWPLRRTSGTS
jgi:predicted RNase H-like HicB family nuclease